MTDQARHERHLRRFRRDIELLSQLPATRRYHELVVEEYPFDAQLLHLSRLYRRSRQLYVAMGGAFAPRLSSMERSLSEQDLFTSEIEFAPALTEMLWFKDHHVGFMTPGTAVAALRRFLNTSLFHEQNHRILWRLLPSPPPGKQGLIRYFNLAESLALTLDVALADEVGESSTMFHRLNVLYRRANDRDWQGQTRANRRRYLLAVFYAMYCRLEIVGRPPQIRKGVAEVLPDQDAINRKAVRRSFEIEDSFMTQTIPRWRRFHWSTARRKLMRARQHASTTTPLRLPTDPFAPTPDLFRVAGSVFDRYLDDSRDAW